MCHSIKNICVQSIGFLVFSHFISAQTPPSTWSGFSGPSHAGPAAVVAEAEKNKFTIPTSTKKYTLQNYLAPRATFNESCYYFAHYCLRAYITGPVCGRTLLYTYYTFKNYCLLDYANCMDRYEVWQIAYMGRCFNITELTEYLLYPYDNDHFLDEYYMVEDH
ncbi:uncharacterized protein LOC116774942 isoform X1 [Danaus plexippus]|uniref:uncharacterized protein LOC116774942 isoform X1 n=1 Tax=Danaus plexippus TaxID=13037 RepID=UPI0013C4490A|nr:uncharacterized protein LOC116774942 isoform X1 [Danaus plexippus]